MLRREVVGGANDVHRPHRREADARQRRHRNFTIGALPAGLGAVAAFGAGLVTGAGVRCGVV